MTLLKSRKRQKHFPNDQGFSLGLGTGDIGVGIGLICYDIVKRKCGPFCDHFSSITLHFVTNMAVMEERKSGFKSISRKAAIYVSVCTFLK